MACFEFVAELKLREATLFLQNEPKVDFDIDIQRISRI